MYVRLRVVYIFWSCGIIELHVFRVTLKQEFCWARYYMTSEYRTIKALWVHPYAFSPFFRIRQYFCSDLWLVLQWLHFWFHKHQFLFWKGNTVNIFKSWWTNHLPWFFIKKKCATNAQAGLGIWPHEFCKWTFCWSKLKVVFESQERTQNQIANSVVLNKFFSSYIIWGNARALKR